MVPEEGGDTEGEEDGDEEDEKNVISEQLMERYIQVIFLSDSLGYSFII